MSAMTGTTTYDATRVGAAAAPTGGAGLDTWRAFLVAHALVTRRLDDELRAEAGISLAEYDAVLDVLESAAGPDTAVVPSVGPYFGTMMVQMGEADGMVSGAVHSTAHTIRPSFFLQREKRRTMINLTSRLWSPWPQSSAML